MLYVNSISNLIGGVSQQPSIMRFQNQGTQQINAVASTVDGLTKRPPCEHISVLKNSAGNDISNTGEIFVHPIPITPTQTYFAVFGDLSSSGGRFFEIYNNSGIRQSITIEDNALNVYLNTSSSYIKATTIADVTFFLNTQKTVAMSASNSLYSRGQSSAIPEALVWVRQTNYQRTHGITINGVTIEHTSGSSTAQNIGTEHIAEQLVVAFNTAKAAGSGTTNPTIQGYTAYQYSSVIFFLRTSGTTALDINVYDDFGGEGMTLIKDEVRSFADLPPNAPHLMKIKVSGNPESQADDYWVEFIQKQSTPSYTSPRSGLWFEAVAPNVKYEYDYGTMPAILIREAGGSWRLKLANGGGSYPNFKWTPRRVGDDTTNPSPTFVGSQISGLNQYQSRLIFLSGENILFSETGEFFNFWRTTVTDSLSTDTIDVASTTPKISILRHVVPFENQLLLFTDTTQFVVGGVAGMTLTPTNVSISPVGDYDNSSFVEPVTSGNSLFFAFGRGSFVGLREMSLRNRLDGKFEAEDISAPVPQYIPSVGALAVSTHENYVVMRSADTSSKELYIYKYFQIGEQRVQSCWSKFQLSSGVPVWAGFINADLYLFTIRGSASNYKISLERMRLQSGRVDSGKTYLTHLDRRVTNTAGLTSSYNATTGLTTYVLPYEIGAGANFQVVTKTGIKLQTTATSTTTATVEGNYPAIDVWAGEAYVMLYEFSEPMFRASTEGSMSAVGGRYQMRYATISFGKTNYFKVKASVEYGPSYEYDYTAKTLGAGSNVLTTDVPLETGSYRFPIYCNSKALRLQIENDSPLPCSIISVEYEATYNDRAQRA